MYGDWNEIIMIMDTLVIMINLLVIRYYFEKYCKKMGNYVKLTKEKH